MSKYSGTYGMRRVIQLALRRAGLEVTRVPRNDPAENLHSDGLAMRRGSVGLKIIDQDRTFLYRILSAVYNGLELRPVVIELGVLRGANACSLREILDPQDLFLIDLWDAKMTKNHDRLANTRNWMVPADDFSEYYGGDLRDQATFDRLFREAHDALAAEANVHFIIEDSQEGLRKIHQELHISANVVYVDASHFYENVLEDLVAASELLVPDSGCLILNDCCHSREGVEQNLGVLEAANKFCRMKDFVPIVAVNRPWTDVILAPRDSMMIHLVDSVFTASEIPFVEVPLELFPNLSISNTRHRSVSFCMG